MTAKELLTAIQLAGQHVHNNSDFSEMLEKKDDIFDKRFINNYIREKHNRMPTVFQNTHFYDIIDESFITLKDTVINTSLEFKNRKIHFCDIPLFGTADFKEFNAFVETADGDAVIVFNEGLLMFTQKLIEIYTLDHWLRANHKMTKQMNELLTLNFLDVMLSFHLFSNAYFAIPLVWCNIDDLDDIGSPEKLYELDSPFDDYLSKEDYITFERQISMSTYLWIAAHEYSHLLLDHLRKHNGTSRLNLSGLEVNKIELKHSQEYDADLLGAIIALESDSSPFIANGIYFAMTCMMLSQIEHDKSSDHPSAEDRIINVFNSEVIRNYHLSNYKNVDAVFVPKIQKFKELLSRIEENDISFSSVSEMQNYIYKVFPQ